MNDWCFDYFVYLGVSGKRITTMTTNEIPQKETEYLNRINSIFINQKIEEVYYQELDYKMESEFWEYSSDIHSVDMNLILKLTNGKLIQIKWDNKFYCYGVGFEEITEINTKKELRLINVTNNKNWRNKIGKMILCIDVYWDESESHEYQKTFGLLIPKRKKKQIRLPLTWAIKFQSDIVFISAFEIRKEGENYYRADNLTVVFNEAETKKYNLLNNAGRYKQFGKRAS